MSKRDEYLRLLRGALSAQGSCRMNHWSDEMAAWWDDVRGWVAFGIAPLAVPIVMAIGAGFGAAPQSMVAAIAFYSLAFSYLGTLLFGVPIYLLLRAYKLTEFWLAPVAGFVAGFAMIYLVTWTFGSGAEGNRPGFAAGLCGAVVGTLLWLIARPDRQSSMHNSQ